MDHGHLVRWDASKSAVHILLLGITDLHCNGASVPPSAPPFLSPAGPYQNLAHLKYLPQISKVLTMQCKHIYNE